MDLEITYRNGQNEDWGKSFLEEGGRIINVKVNVRSHEDEKCDSKSPMRIRNEGERRNDDIEINYTYSVKYVVSVHKIFKNFIGIS